LTPSKTWIAVPTYWTFPSTEKGEEQTIFDHPTPLDGEDTLVRTLESFRNLKGDFNVLVVAAGTHPSLGARIHEKVFQLIKPFAAHFPIYLASPANLPALNSLLGESILELNSYGNIRNVQLALPYLAGCDKVIGIDDDELIEVPDYLTQVNAAVGSKVNDETVAGIAGPYFDRKGEYRIEGAESLARIENMFIKKNYFMNEALKIAMKDSTIRRCNVAFGGNMAMARNTIARVCHDPYIPRGEDYDYVINAAMRGLFFYILPTAGIVHLPPDSTGSQAADKDSKLLADIRRFIYMRTKNTRHQKQYPKERFDLNYLQPYPGCYLDERYDLKAHGIAAIREKIPTMASVAERFVEDAATVAETKTTEFFAYRDTWTRVLTDAGKRVAVETVANPFRVR
jgi:hypothetical protein